MKFALGLCVLAAVALSGWSARAAGPKNIFDDGWMPPKSSEKPRPAPVKPTAAENSKPAETPPTPPKNQTSAPVQEKVETIPAPVPVKLRPVPGKDQQAASRNVLKEVFADQLVDRTIPGRRKLTEALLAEADKSAAQPVDQFVLLAAAIDAGVEAANLPLAFTACERMSAVFDVDALALKMDAASRLGNKPGAADLAGENVRAGLELVDALADVDDFVAASRVCATLMPVTGSNAALREDVRRRQRELAVAREASERFARQVQRLKAVPKDPAANLEVGKYLCFTKGDWKEGLPELALGADGALKALANKELAGAKTADARAALGDAWWDLAHASAGPAKAAILAHAADWYAKAAPELDGLAKAKVEKRIADVAKLAAVSSAKSGSEGGRVVDLLKLIDPEKDTVQGKFAIENGELVTTGTGEQRIEIPYHPPDEYDFRIEFTRPEKKGPVIQILTENKTPFIWVMQDNYTFHYVQGGGLFANNTTVNGVPGIRVGTRYTSIVQVRKGGVKTFLNGKLIADWKTDYTNIDSNAPFWKLRDNSILGLGTGGTGTVFHSASLYEVTGVGSKAR